MIPSNKKISMHQVSVIFILITMSPAIRLFPQYCAQVGGKAGWLAPIVMILPMAAFIFLINAFFKNNQNANLSDVYFDILGKTVGRIIVLLYFLWTLILISLYIRYYYERIVASMMPNASNAFLVIVMLVLMFFAVRSGLTTVARASEVFFVLFIVVFAVIFIFAAPQVEKRNLLNVSYLDAWPVVKSSYALFAIWGYFLFLFFLGDKITKKDQIKKHGLRSFSIVFVLAALLLVITIGALGSMLISHVSLPFFMVTKSISILEIIDHVEAIVLSLWVTSDFVVITMFTFIAAAMMKSVFNLSESKSMMTPIILLTGVGAIYLFKNRLELEQFSLHVLFPLNCLFAYIIPLIVFGIGKIRKKL